MTSARSAWRRRYSALDVILFAYTAFIAGFTVIFYARMPRPLPILVLHVVVMAAIVLLPPRGAAWETLPLPGWKRHARGGLRFFRYSYPLLLILFYFEEGSQTVNAMWPRAPYWFEPYLYAADRSLFGELPAVLLNDWVGPIRNEIFHGFYFSYYFILIGGVVMAWLGTGGAPKPGPAFHTTLTSVITAFFLCFVWYPFLPARGPWENPELMAGLTEFRGFLFVPIIERIIDAGAVSGGCFPSSHVAGAWASVLGLMGFHRKRALVLGICALGMSAACVYTRYHHAVDVPAGFIAGLVGAAIGYRLTATKRGEERGGNLAGLI